MEMGALHTWEGIMLLSGVHAARGFHPTSIKAKVYSYIIRTTGWGSISNPLTHPYSDIRFS